MPASTVSALARSERCCHLLLGEALEHQELLAVGVGFAPEEGLRPGGIDELHEERAQQVSLRVLRLGSTSVIQRRSSATPSSVAYSASRLGRRCRSGG
jgi:hypothetical protein